MFRAISCFLLVLLLPALAWGELRVAVASNFLGTLNELAPLYEADSGQTLRISSGSTGRHYAQIVNGAPFDVFLAADKARPQRLVDEGLALPESRFTYAQGVLVLWSTLDSPLDEGRILKSEELEYLALVNPRTAPYGAAAVEVMQQLGMYENLRQKEKIAQAENLTQALQYVTSGTAQAGFLALAQIIEEDGSTRGFAWQPPAELYTPLEQQAVVLTSSPQQEASQQFLDWLQSEEARAVIRAAGYDF